ncbi:MAG: HAMP domain-containing histidine kinase [Candidatus Aminicenantes bacterium]|nr:HAMP domain-containing histidine kinase [Candidatus Aminicenantes bacterium]
MKNISEDRKALTIMAHDIKVPLSAIIDLLDVISKGYVDDMTKILELVGRARQRAETLVRMLDDILDYTLLADKSLMKREVIDIIDVIAHSVKMMSNYAAAMKVTIKNREDFKGEKFVYGNYTFLLRVFNNIIMNAIKYNNESGEIFISYKEDSKKKALSISIRDTGIGIPREEIGKVFKIFERGKHARRNIDGSLGLGLALVKQIVDDHYGEIGITSVPGEGTTITVTLPLLDRESAAQAPGDRQQRNKEE